MRKLGNFQIETLKIKFEIWGYNLGEGGSLIRQITVYIKI
jgi:hypothetical protein